LFWLRNAFSYRFCNSGKPAIAPQPLFSRQIRTELLDKKHHKALKGMEVQSADGKRCGFDDVELVRVKVTRGGGFKTVST